MTSASELVMTETKDPTSVLEVVQSVLKIRPSESEVLTPASEVLTSATKVLTTASEAIYGDPGPPWSVAPVP